MDAQVNSEPTTERVEMSVDRWREVFDVNVIGSFICAREAVRRMSTRHGGAGGSIVNVSSAASYLGSPGEYIDDAASKAAIDTMTMGLGKEVAEEGIRVNAVRPGVIYTDIRASGGDRVGSTVSPVGCRCAGVVRPTKSRRRSCGWRPMLLRT